MKAFPLDRRLLMGSAAIAMSLLAGTAAAQTADDEEVVDEVVATGIIASIERSIELKRDETSIIEAVSAEDIGKLPDISIAESLSRLPGLAAQRVRGRAQVLSVRGLGPDFTTALLNGREQVTAGDNRGVEFDQFPSELLSSAVVYKTPDAALIGTGLSGTVDLRTIRPLDYNGDSNLVVNARYEINDLGELNSGSNDDGYRLTGTYVGENADGTLGWMIGGATQSSPSQSERWEAWGYPTTGANNAAIIGGAKPYAESRDLERDSVVGTLQFAPTDNLEIIADGFYTSFKDGGILRGIELPLFWSGAQLQDGFTETDGIVSAGTFANQNGVIRNDVRSRDADLMSLGLNADYRFADKWGVNFDISHSRIERDDRDLETYTGAGAANLGFQLRDNGAFVFNTDQNYEDPNSVQLADPGGWGQVGFIKEPQTDDELTALRGEIYREIDDRIVSGFQIGANYTTRSKDKDSVESFIDLAGSPDGNRAAVPSDALLAPTNLAFLGLGNVISYDPNQVLASGVYALRPNLNADVITKAWNVEEDVTTVYGKVDLDTSFGGVPMRGNLGLQVVSTDQQSTGPAVQGGNLALVTDGAEYTDVLPSANFSFEVLENAYFRLGAARTLARPRMEQLKASTGIGLNNNICGIADGEPFFFGERVSLADQQVCIAGGGGNPQLRPFKATSLDASFEKYFADNAGYVSIAAFTKKLDDFIFDGVTDVSAQGSDAFDFTPIANDIFGADFVAANTGLAQGFVTRPQNSEGGSISGIELATNIPFGHFAEALEGFGVFASYSYTDSDVDRPGTTESIQIPGLSTDIASVQVYYERNGFQARVSNRYRSSFLGEIIGFGAGTVTRSIDSENVVDGQIGYEFQDGPLERVSLILQGYNLTDEEFATRFDNSGLVRDVQNYGRTFLLGVGYSF